MNHKEVKNRKYTKCIIDCGEYGRFEAKVKYNDHVNAWQPSEVLFFGDWISIDKFDDTEPFNCYSCEDYA